MIFRKIAKSGRRMELVSDLNKKEFYWVHYGPEINTETQRAIGKKMSKINEVTRIMGSSRGRNGIGRLLWASKSI